MEQFNTPITVWGAFIGFIIVMLVIDLGLFLKNPHEITTREAITWTIIWIVLAMILNVIIYFWRGPNAAFEYFTAYLVEKSLSIDNIFVFITTFSYFAVPRQYRHEVLFLGILGAIITRLIFIVIGIALISQFDWILYVFGIILIFTGVKLLIKHEDVNIEKNPFLKAARRLLPVTKEYKGAKFFVLENKKLFVTPLLLVLLVIETTDIIFAVDSIPAVFGITRDPFIAFSSNIMAIFGLRALYFVFETLANKFEYLYIGIATILIFIGAKMLVAKQIHIPTYVTLPFIASVIALCIWGSITKKHKEESQNNL